MVVSFQVPLPGIPSVKMITTRLRSEDEVAGAFSKTDSALERPSSIYVPPFALSPSIAPVTLEMLSRMSEVNPTLTVEPLLLLNPITETR